MFCVILPLSHTTAPEQSTTWTRFLTGTKGGFLVQDCTTELAGYWLWPDFDGRITLRKNKAYNGKQLKRAFLFRVLHERFNDFFKLKQVQKDKCCWDHWFESGTSNPQLRGWHVLVMDAHWERGVPLSKVLHCTFLQSQQS